MLRDKQKTFTVIKCNKIQTLITKINISRNLNKCIYHRKKDCTYYKIYIKIAH